MEAAWGSRPLNEPRKDVLLALALIGIGAVALVSILMTTGERRIMGAEAMTFATMPAIYSGFLIGLSLLFLIGVLRRARSAPNVAAHPATPEADAPSGPSPRTINLRTGGTLLILMLFAGLIEHVHFWVLTTAFLAAMFVLFGQRSIKRVGLVSVCGGTAFYALFILALDLPI
jgi:Tripartite tricarboxylate transporter TctB family